MKPRKQKEIDIEDYYSIRIRPMWVGLRQESWAFWWLCIYIFIEYVRPQSIYPEIAFIPWAQLSLIMAFGCLFLDKSVQWVNSKENGLFILLFLIVVLTSIFAFHPFIAWSKFDRVLNWIIVYFLVITVVNTEKRFFILLLLFLLVNFKMSQHGFRSFVSRGFSFAGWGVKGAPGWFANSGEFGIEMTIFVPLSLAFILALKERWGRFKKLFFYLMPVTGLFTIAATSSRGAQLAILGVGLWYLLKNRVGFKAVAWLLIIGLVLYALIPDEQWSRFETMGEDNTSAQRLAYWKYGIEVMSDRPLLGIGHANWIDYCWFMTDGIGPMNICQEAHNTLIQAGTEHGIPGLIVYLLMVIQAFSINSRTRALASDSGNRLILYITHGLDGGLIGYLISSFFISALFYPFFWIQMAIIVALHQVARRNQSKTAEIIRLSVADAR